jgi:hypothetical protein
VEPNRRTHPSVQVLLLCLCGAAAGGIVPTLRLPWFGTPTDSTVRTFSAVSEELWRSGLVPAAQSWGYLIAAWSLLLVVLALVGASTRALFRSHDRWPMSGFLACLGVVSVVLIALVLAEVTTRAQFDLVSSANSDWGAWTGLGLAVTSSVTAWLAWATWTFPHLWGLDPSAD